MMEASVIGKEIKDSSNFFNIHISLLLKDSPRDDAKEKSENEKAIKDSFNFSYSDFLIVGRFFQRWTKESIWKGKSIKDYVWDEVKEATEKGKEIRENYALQCLNFLLT